MTGTDLYGVFLRIANRNGGTIAATADRGTFLATDDPDVILFRLTNGRLVHNAPDYRAPRVLSFAAARSADQPARDREFPRPRRRHQGADHPRAAPARQRSAAVPQARRNAIRANFHFRMVEVAMMLLVPLARGGAGGAAEAQHVGARHLRRDHLRRHLSQGESICRADGRARPVRSDHRACGRRSCSSAGSIVWMYWTLAHKPGGQPIGALERVFAKLSKLVGRLLRPAAAASRRSPAT